MDRDAINATMEIEKWSSKRSDTMKKKTYWGNVTKCRRYGDQVTLAEFIRMLYAAALSRRRCRTTSLSSVTGFRGQGAGDR